MKTDVRQPGVLPPGASLARLADILRFACVLGNGADGFRRCSPEAKEDGHSRPASPEPDFNAAVLNLFRLLRERGARYLLVGGAALLRYVPGRNTEDIDLLLAVDELASLPEIVLQERTEWFGKGAFQGIRVDLLFTVNPLFHRVQECHGTSQFFLEQDVPCASAEGLLLLKLYALPSLYRQGDLQRANLYEGDVAALLLAVRPNVELLFSELQTHVSPTDLTELRKIVAEAQERSKRFGNTAS